MVDNWAVLRKHYPRLPSCSPPVESVPPTAPILRPGEFVEVRGRRWLVEGHGMVAMFRARVAKPASQTKCADNMCWKDAERAAEKDRHELQFCYRLRTIERHGSDPALRQRAMALYLRDVAAVGGDEATAAARHAF